MKQDSPSILPEEVLLNKIYLIRGQKVMLDRDLAELYVVETKRLKEQVKRNIDRFPDDFMFEMTKEENAALRSQSATLKRGRHSKFLPYCFTEHGILMLSSVLNSEQAINTNIRIMRLFAKMREMILSHKELLLELEEIRKKLSTQDERIDLVFDYLTQFITKDVVEEERKVIGFKTEK